MDYLLTKGIAPERLMSDGFGETTPIVLVDGTVLNEKYITGLKTKDEQEAAHQKNRRTAFEVIKQDDLKGGKKNPN